MASFKELVTPEDIRLYLLDVIGRTLKANKEACIYHYSDFTSIYNIITSGYIWLGSTQKMNDILEGEFIEAMRGSHKVYSICFSRSEENLAMYKMYAPNPDGAMLSFPLMLAQKMIDELDNYDELSKAIRIVRNKELTIETTPAILQWTAIAYKDLHGDTLRLNNHRNNAIEKPLAKRELAGFVKLYGWEYEKEVRLIAHVSTELEENDRVAVKLPDGFLRQIQVVTGPAFIKEHHKYEIARLTRMGITIQDSTYDALVDLGGSFNNNAKKKILELERENSRLREELYASKNRINESQMVLEEKAYQKKKYSELRNESNHVLHFYANVYTNIIGRPDVEHEEASRALRNIGVKFKVFIDEVFINCPEIPSKNDLQEVSGQFIGLSNRMYVHKGGDAGRLLDDNIKAVKIIKEILKLK